MGMKIKASMGNWRSKIISKRNRGSSTPGKQKGISCQATALEKYMAKSSRSYKHPLYSKWCSIFNGEKRNHSIG